MSYFGRPFWKDATPLPIDPDVVLSIAQTEFGCSRAELLSRRRLNGLVNARAFAVWTLRSLGGPLSYPRIGRAIGGRDHATIINLHRKAIALRLTDPAFRGACERIRGRFNAMREHSHA